MTNNKNRRDVYNVIELLLKPRKFFFIPTNKSDVYYKHKEVK